MKKACLCLFTSLLLLVGCSNSIQTMLDDYNSKFTVESAETLPVPGDADFDERDMLMDEYYVASDDTFTVCAPYNCSSYEWVVTDPKEDNSVINMVMYGDYTSVQREFVTYIPDSGLKVGHTYRLTLKVTDKDENVYTDVSGLVIYKHYIFDAESDGSLIVDDSQDEDTDNSEIISEFW